ncbi:unnamed protein product, partial [Prorocentrum cordatum]
SQFGSIRGDSTAPRRRKTRAASPADCPGPPSAHMAATDPQLGQPQAARFTSKAVSSQPSLDSISTTTSCDNLLRTSGSSSTWDAAPHWPDSLDDSGTEFDGTPSIDTAPATPDRRLESRRFSFRHPPAARLGPHLGALKRVPRVHDFRAMYDLDAVGEFDEPTDEALQQEQELQ